MKLKAPPKNYITALFVLGPLDGQRMIVREHESVIRHNTCLRQSYSPLYPGEVPPFETTCTTYRRETVVVGDHPIAVFVPMKNKFEEAILSLVVNYHPRKPRDPNKPKRIRKKAYDIAKDIAKIQGILGLPPV